MKEYFLIFHFFLTIYSEDDSRENFKDDNQENKLDEILLPAFSFEWNKSLQPRDRIVLIGRILSDATELSIKFFLNTKSNTIAYQMTTMISDGTVVEVLHNWRDDTQWQNEEKIQPYKIHDGNFELAYEFHHGKVRVFDEGNNLLHEYSLHPPLEEIKYLEVWEATPKTVQIDEIRFQYKHEDD